MKKYLIKLLYYCDVADEWSSNYVVLDIDTDQDLYIQIYDAGYTTFDDYRWLDVSDEDSNWIFPTKY